MVIFFAVFLGCYIFDVVAPIVRGWFLGYSNNTSLDSATASFRETSVALAVLGIVAVASTSAVSITGEREQDTWISLATTLVTPREVIRGKQFGAVWSARRIGLALFVLWSAGVLMGAIHPLGVLASAFTLGLTSWCVAAVGVFISTRAKNSMRALIATFITLIILSYCVSWYAILPLMSYEDLAPDTTQSIVRGPRVDVTLMITAMGWLIVVLGSIALIATKWSIVRLRANWGEG
jgi:hypothetical protein